MDQSVKRPTKEEWFVLAKKADFAKIGERFGIDPVIARIIRNRDICTEEGIELFLNGTRRDLHDPYLMKDVSHASEILKEKIHSKKKICIIGDYDIDGVQATYILLNGLLRCGADAHPVIPDRIADGYGLNENLIYRAAESGVDTILTCDNGISASEQIRLAKQLGMTVVVTDHHEVPFVIEDGVKKYISTGADATVNPKQQDCPYPFKELCGASVAFKFVQVLYDAMGIDSDEADVFIENAGFATVGDVMDLQGENRILVKLGLEMLNRTTVPGMKALILQNGLALGSLKAYHIGFRIGPCLNASGRLETAKLSLKLLLAETVRDASELAREIVELNENRKCLTSQAVEEAKNQVEENYLNDKVLVVFLPDCHESLAGIVAGRLREHYCRPALVITRGSEGTKGSGRSTEAYSMYEELCKCSALLDKFGGHPMAAGFSLPEQNIQKLRECLNQNTSLTDRDLVPKIRIDVPMPIGYITVGLIRQLSLLEPFGKGNEKPMFADRDIIITSLRLVGKEKNIVSMRLTGTDGTCLDAVYFGEPEKLRLSVAEKYGMVVADEMLNGKIRQRIAMNFTYYPEIDDYYQKERIKLIISGFC